MPKTILFREYVLEECERQWAECQEADGYGAWAAQTEDVRRMYFADMYQFLWHNRRDELDDGILIPAQPETDAWEKLAHSVLEPRWFAVTRWAAEDVIAIAEERGVTVTTEQAEAWWARNESWFQNLLVERGNEILSEANFGEGN